MSFRSSQRQIYEEKVESRDVWRDVRFFKLEKERFSLMSRIVKKVFFYLYFFFFTFELPRSEPQLMFTVKEWRESVKRIDITCVREPPSLDSDQHCL